ncbi:hypothetical protein CU633_06050 [Bacillus sp. V3-13]|uniref:pre-toxin TG domain-containing protein n=1 Tax=Bacillus sp. V3-13 TaxID=2053728 RepID=UPI000C763FB6|nr:pre-toxin TG domain-containing protein [Bacillus sp. V3-13]PLR78368.1 hypothetical protein CU633_06050 [Bacillus sp. V3-13]
MTRIQIKVDDLEEFADQIGKAERDCSQALNAVTWHFNSLLADFPGVLPGGIQDLEAEFKEAIRRYKDKLDEAQHLIKMTAGGMREADQKLAGEIGEFLLEVVGWYDVQRIFAEYDPITGEKLSAGERALATGMVLATLFPPAKVVGVVGKTAFKGGKAVIGAASISGLTSLAKNSEVFIRMRNVFNPKKVSDAFKVVYNHVVKGPLTATKLWFDKAFKKIGDMPVPAFLQPQLAGYGRVQSSMREVFADAKESVMRIVSGGKSDAVGVVSNTGKKPEKLKFTKEQLATKPPFSRDPEKWLAKGGIIEIDSEGIWTYIDWEIPPNRVSYPGGFPDFKSAGMVIQEVKIGKFEKYDTDFALADELAPNGPKSDKNTWHHHEDLTTMQEINKELHRRFRHKGGMSLARKSED